VAATSHNFPLWPGRATVFAPKLASVMPVAPKPRTASITNCKSTTLTTPSPFISVVAEASVRTDCTSVTVLAETATSAKLRFRPDALVPWPVQAIRPARCPVNCSLGPFPSVVKNNRWTARPILFSVPYCYVLNDPTQLWRHATNSGRKPVAIHSDGSSIDQSVRVPLGGKLGLSIAAPSVYKGFVS